VYALLGLRFGLAEVTRGAKPATLTTGGHRRAQATWGEGTVPTMTLTLSWIGEPVRLVIVGEVDLETREQFNGLWRRRLAVTEAPGRT
jgi:hypothetical protein